MGYNIHEAAFNRKLPYSYSSNGYTLTDLTVTICSCDALSAAASHNVAFASKCLLRDATNIIYEPDLKYYALKLTAQARLSAAPAERFYKLT
jgi:hypothetical protein